LKKTFHMRWGWGN